MQLSRSLTCTSARCIDFLDLKTACGVFSFPGASASTLESDRLHAGLRVNMSQYTWLAEVANPLNA